MDTRREKQLLVRMFAIAAMLLVVFAAAVLVTRTANAGGAAYYTGCLVAALSLTGASMHTTRALAQLEKLGLSEPRWD